MAKSIRNDCSLIYRENEFIVRPQCREIDIARGPPKAAV